MADYIFKIAGSAKEPYEVSVTLSPLVVTCSCPAAAFGSVCKHRTQLLLGKNPGITDGDVSVLPAIAQGAAAAGFPPLFKRYEAVKADRADSTKKLENLFKGYKEERLRRYLGELKTERQVEKARDILESAIDEAGPIEAEFQGALAELRKILI
ncbi:hypothetical protein LQZ19_08470 [Treponema primitia]|uniref:hypothetical protein n=1 Tax=Treponema primitia TaxID=88058 RepID=UPI0039810895